MEAVGAGDHVNIAENNIKTLKERIRCKKTDLAWRLPKRLKEPLVVYSTGRVNMIPPHSGSSSECARVRFLERKIDVPKELGISFGDYCEVPIDRGSSSSSSEPRTASCIALYPVATCRGVFQHRY